MLLDRSLQFYSSHNDIAVSSFILPDANKTAHSGRAGLAVPPQTCAAAASFISNRSMTEWKCK
jgi:hypothetical protein